MYIAINISHPDSKGVISLVDIHWFRLDPPKVKIWQKKIAKTDCVTMC